jgi:hypothetical protein
MRYLITILFLSIYTDLLYADSNITAPETKWTHSWSQGEDATSTFYYFIEVSDQVVRVRMLWNGGAQNKPTLTDWFLDSSSSIRVVKKNGERSGIAELIQGKDTTLKITSEYKLARDEKGMMLVPSTPDKSLTEEQRVDLTNLISLLSENRDLYKQKAQQSGTSNGG